MFRRNSTPRPSPIVPRGNTYAQRAADSLSVYNADMEPPATSYVTSNSPISSRYANPVIGPKVNAPYVTAKPRLNGLRFNWSWGSVNMGQRTASLPGPGVALNGGVRSTMFQPILVQLHDWTTNLGWYIAWNGTGAGMFQQQKAERYQYPSFRVSQINTSLTGGPGPTTMRMRPSPRFTSVQAIRKYTAQPSYYNTQGSKA